MNDRTNLIDKYKYGNIDPDVYSEVVKIFKKEQEKEYIKQLKALKKKNKKEIKRNARTKLLR